MNDEPNRDELADALKSVRDAISGAFRNLSFAPTIKPGAAFKVPTNTFVWPGKNLAEHRRKARNRALVAQMNAERRGEGPKKNRHQRRAAAKKGKR